MTTISGTWLPAGRQRAYRSLLRALSYPGQIAEIAGESVDEPAWLAVLATLCDHATTLADPHGLLDQRSRDLLRAAAGGTSTADFVLCDAGRDPEGLRPALGELEHPEQGAMLVLAGKRVGEGPLTLWLQGPGVNGRAELRLDGFHPDWFLERADWVADFPRGVDIILCDGVCVAAIPRTTIVGDSGREA